MMFNSNLSSSPPHPHRPLQPLGRQENTSDDQQQDHAVKSTADDAILHKLACVEKGYYDDPFINAMSRGASGLVNKKQSSSSSSGASSSTTQPIIRRGTHARVKVIDRAINAFLSLPLTTSIRQVVVLGSGRDTTYLRHRFGNEQPKVDDHTVRWYEVDHPSVIVQKAHSWLPRCIPKGYDYKRQASEETGDSYTITIAASSGRSESDVSSNYHLIGYDLRSSPATLFGTLCSTKHGYDRSIPTLFVFECVLMYMPDEKTWDLLQYLAESPTKFSTTQSSVDRDPFVAVVIYDPIPSNDRFGQLMINNLQKAGIMGRRRKRGHVRATHNETDDDDDDKSSQLSLEKTQTLSDQITKLTKSGFDIAVGCDMMAAYNHGVLSMEDFRRAARCEMLDELEEFNLLMKHYCLVVGVSSPAGKDNHKCDDEDGSMMCEFDSIGFTFCSVGKDSPMGFKEGHCMAMKR